MRCRQLITGWRGGRLLWLWVALVASLWATGLQAETRALLIGVSQYPSLAVKDRLKGPGNDVLLLREALIARGVPVGNMVVLSDDARLGAPMPTKKRIVDALQSLGQSAKPGDHFILYLSGHGARLPAIRRGAWAEKHPETDGLDEVFMPIDAVRDDGNGWQAQAGLFDNEIGELLQAWHRKQAFVWAIFDTCSAGDMAKNSKDTEPVSMNRLYPMGAMGSVLPRGRSRLSSSSMRSRGPPVASAIYFYATQPDQAAPEELLPTPSVWPEHLDGGRRHRVFGVFTHTLVKAMEDNPATFKDLGERVMRGYAQRLFTTPMFEGDLAHSFQIFREEGLRKPPTDGLHKRVRPMREGGRP
jgi:Caspase domain